MVLMIPKVRKAVFPAAGLGTRFLPATKAQPKEMLPVVDKPLIQYGVEEAIHSGVKNIIIVTGRNKSSIEDHFDVSFELERILEAKGKKDLLAIVQGISDMISVAYVRQKEALGLGHAVLRARELVGPEPFAVVLSDDVIRADTPCLRQLLDIYESYGASVVALMEVPEESVSAYGVVEAEPVDHGGSTDRLFRIRNLVEKPRRGPSNLRVALPGPPLRCGRQARVPSGDCRVGPGAGRPGRTVPNLPQIIAPVRFARSGEKDEPSEFLGNHCRSHDGRLRRIERRGAAKDWD